MITADQLSVANGANKNTSMFEFFALSDDFVITILSQWLSLKDISAVDAATCNQTLRPTLLPICQTMHLFFNAMQDVYNGCTVETLERN